MSIGDNTIETVFSQVVPLYGGEANDIYGGLALALIKGVPVIDYILSATTSDAITNKVDRMRRYAVNDYILGLPDEVRSSAESLNPTDVADAICDSVGLTNGCLIAFSCITNLSSLHLILPHLINSIGMDIRTGIILTPPTGYIENPPVISTDIKMKSIIKVSNAVLSADNSSLLITYTTTFYHYNYEHIWPSGNDAGNDYWGDVYVFLGESTYSETIDAPVIIAGDISMDVAYCIAGYQIIDNEGETDGVTHWWYYDMASSFYPTLSNTTEINEGIGYPVIPIRYKMEFMSETNHPEIYTQGSKMLSMIGVNFDDIVTEIETNENAEDLDHAYIGFGVNMQTEDPIDIKYLIKYFTYVAAADDIDIWDVIYGYTVGTNAPTHQVFDYRDSSIEIPTAVSTTETTYVAETRDGPEEVVLVTTTTVNRNQAYFQMSEHCLNVTVTYENISSLLVAGNIFEDGSAKIGDVSKTYNLVEELETPTWSLGLSSNPDHIVWFGQNHSSLVLREQVAVNRYREVIVRNPVCRNMIYGFRSVITNLHDVAASTDEMNFIIPLHHTVVEWMSPLEKDTLYKNALCLILTGYDIHHNKWYESDVFLIVTFIIAAALAIFTCGKSLVGWAALIAEVGLMAALITIVIDIIIGIIIGMVIKVIISWVGPGIGMILAIIAMAYGCYNSITGASFCFLGVMGMTPTTLINMAVTMAKACVTYVKEEIAEIIEEYEAWLLEAAAQQEVLDAAKSELYDDYTGMPISYILTPAIVQSVPMESPTAFYSRKLKNNLVPSLCSSVIPNYVTAALSLPETNCFSNIQLAV